MRQESRTKVSWLCGTRIECEVQFRTFTPGSPRTARSRPSVFCWTSSRTLSSLNAASFSDARSLEFGITQADLWIEAAARRSNCIGRHGLGFAQTIFIAIRRYAVFDRIVQFLRSRSQIAAARTRGVVTVAGGGRTRMKIFSRSENAWPNNFEPRTLPSGPTIKLPFAWSRNNSCEIPKTMSG